MSDARQLVPNGFEKVCREAKGGLAMLIVLLGLGVVGCVVAGLSWGVERKIQRCRGEREVLGSREGRGGDGLGGMPYEKQGGDV